MITTTKTAAGKIEALRAYVDGRSAAVLLQHRVTGEVLKIDSNSLFAGISAGMVMAAEIVGRREPMDAALFEGAMVSGIKAAAEAFVERTEDEWDEWAAEAAEAVRTEGRDDA